MAQSTQEETEAVTARVLDRFTAAAMLFTALDVSNAVKESLPDVRHRDISPLVRQALERGALGPYQSTQIDVNAGGKTVQALLYHLPTQAPDLYDEKMRSQLARAPKKGADKKVTDAQIQDETVSASVPVGHDGRGRMSRRLLANAGLDGDEVLVVASQNPPQVKIFAEDSEAEEADDGEPVSFEHPDLLYLSAEMLKVFPQGVQLVARVESECVVVSSTTTVAPSFELNGCVPYPVM
ncbi:MAG: hypothetical protein Q8S33_01505 [Myxococcales bacterium]|nr:hypothetical protein [Myxococcales bacterium]